VRRLRWIAGLLLVALGARTARGQIPRDGAVRFEVREVADSTFDFDGAGRRWIKPGQQGVAVDPRRRDVLVARFVVLHVDDRNVTALITGQTSRVSTEHVAILQPPTSPWYRARLFWIGAVAGLAAAIAGDAAIR
jgi:hypothetical protein